MNRRTSKADERQALDLLRQRVTQREVARRLGLSKSTVARLALSAAPPKAAPAPRSKPTARVAPPAPVRELDPADARGAELEAAIDASHAQGDHAAVTAACKAAALHADEHAADAVEEGATYVDALLNSPTHGTAVQGIGSAEDFAELARTVVDVGFGHDQEEGESDEAFAAYLAEQKSGATARAVQLLERALVLVLTAPTT